MWAAATYDYVAPVKATTLESGSPMNRHLAVTLLLLVIAACGETDDETQPGRPSSTLSQEPRIETLQPLPRPDTRGKVYVRIPGSGVSLVRPDGLEDAKRYPGFRQPSTGASVMVMEQPHGGFAEIRKGFAPEKARSYGLTVLGTRHGTVDGHPAVLAEIQQPVAGLTLHKWALLLGNETKAVIINAAYPESHVLELRAVLEDMLLAVRWNPSARPDPFTSLGFRIDAKGLQFAHRMGNMLLFSRDGRVVSERYAVPTFTASRSIQSASFLSQSWFARRRLRSLPHFRDLKILAEKDLEIDDLEAVEILAEANSRKWDVRVFLYQVVIFENDDNYNLLLGTASLQDREKYEPVFRRIAATFRLSDDEAETTKARG